MFRWSQPDLSTHHCADNGAKVNLTDCSHSKDKGTTELNTTGRILNFKLADHAFHYVRVFENPTCRWSTDDAIKLKTNVPDGYPAVIQERAWSSPIWYEPSAAQVASK